AARSPRWACTARPGPRRAGGTAGASPASRPTAPRGSQADALAWRGGMGEEAPTHLLEPEALVHQLLRAALQRGQLHRLQTQQASRVAEAQAQRHAEIAHEAGGWAVRVLRQLNGPP